MIVNDCISCFQKVCELFGVFEMAHLFHLELTPGTEYSVSVRAMTVNGTGSQTMWVSTETFTNDLDGMYWY